MPKSGSAGFQFNAPVNSGGACRLEIGDPANWKLRYNLKRALTSDGASEPLADGGVVLPETISVNDCGGALSK